MSLKFCANLSFMFQEEVSLLKRYDLARTCGFKAVECAWPYDIPLDTLCSVKKELKQVLINTPVCGDGIGKLGYAALPGETAAFINGLETAIKYAKSLDCSLIHIMSGTTTETNEVNDQTYIDNLKKAVVMLEKEDITALIEPINKYSVPNYYMNSYEKAVSVIKEVNSNKLRLLLDIFHLQQIKGNLSRNLEELMPYVGHIQIAQVPHRHEPNTLGEINYRYLLQFLEKLGYSGWIGLEYKPIADTAPGLTWINDYGFHL